MRRILWPLVKPLFLYERFAYRTKLPGDQSPQLYERITLIPAPGPEMLIALLVLSFAWYVAWLGGAVWWLLGAWDWRVGYAAIPLAANAALRGSLKVREQLAERADWPRAVGRRRRGVLLSAIAIGGLVGALSGVLLEFTLARHLTSVLPMWAIIAIPASWEALQNGRHIGGKHPLPDFKVDEHRKWYRVNETPARPKPMA